MFLSRTIGWLQVDAELDAIYFTAPPLAFDETQAEWYLRPDLTKGIEESMLLKEAIGSHPIPHNAGHEQMCAERKKPSLGLAA